MPTVNELPAAAAAADSDLVMVSQGGQARSLTRAQLLAGTQAELVLAKGQLVGRSQGVGAAQALTIGPGLAMSGTTLIGVPAQGNDAVPVESFGARGDGVTDDTAALDRALASGRPVRLGARTYRVDGQWTITQPGAVLLGAPGLSVLKRGAQASGGAWIAVQADGFHAEGVIFDAGGAEVPGQAWGVLLTAACMNAHISRCWFRAASGPVLGCGLAVQAAAGGGRVVVRDCEFSGNAAHGLWVQAREGVEVSGCRAWGNGAYGINVDYNDAGFALKARLVQVLGNRCWGNLRGIAVGNYNQSNAEPPVWGNANPDALAVLVSGNLCHGNGLYGIAVAGQGLQVAGNLLADNGTAANGGGGILANAAASRICGNTITNSAAGGAGYGIDCGGSVGCDVSGNMVQGALFGINCGGSADLLVCGNTVRDCTIYAVNVANTEADGEGRGFGIVAANIAITGNRIGLGTGGGVWLRDGAEGVTVAGNSFVGGTAAGCLRADTDAVLVGGNTHDGAAAWRADPVEDDGLQRLVFPDIADDIWIGAAPDGVDSMVSASQAGAAGGIAFVRVTAGGSGYSQAVLTIGSPGAGGAQASAEAVIRDGAVIGAMVTAAGSRYGRPGTAVAVAVSGDGAGAQAVAYPGGRLPEGRRLRVRCDVPVRFRRAGSNPLQDNWNFADLPAASASEVVWTATGGAWRAGAFAATNRLCGDGTGGTLLTSDAAADVVLRPGDGGRLRLASAAEPAGCLSLVGRGSPEGGRAAPPGSDYRNLDGVAGMTLWIKTDGVDATGWMPVA